MPTKTPRERFEELYYSTLTVSGEDQLEFIWSHISALLEEARQEMKEKCLAFITNPDEMVNEQYRFASKQDYAEHIRNSISSL